MSENELPLFEDLELKNSINSVFKRHSRFTQGLYLILLALLLLISIGMVSFKIPVFVNARGILRPSAELNNILCPIQGLISRIDASENQYLQKGQSILQINCEKEEAQRILIKKELELIRSYLSDIKSLTDSTYAESNLISQKYTLESELFFENLAELNLRLFQIKLDFDRDKSLFDKNYLSKKEFEESTLKYNTILNEKSKVILTQKNRWENDRNELFLRDNALVKNLTELDFYIDNSTITAPVSGIIQGIRNHYKGEFCSGGSNLCRIIPDTSIIAELYIQPRDIGFINAGQRTRLLIDSYDYRYWGVLEAECISVSKDVEIINDQALFRVICSVKQPSYMEYKGIKVIPGKGMTLTAQFYVAERNTAQLIADEAYALIYESTLKSKMN